ncbi:MAG: peptidylprolyl isomerase [Bacteroidales bacterium]|nr:peptidylprolyl isomerase [Bacteroidales bacterium]MDE6538322.1 FKBP-type peptidyl-prolyl cis-trans isomerase [Muribaculaceae bacterium]
MAENKEVVGPGKFVEYSYRLYDAADGKLLFETEKGKPDFMVYGVSHEIVPGLIEVMRGLKAGDKFEIELPPAAAFGEPSPEYFMELDKEIFMRDGQLAEEVKVGADLPMMTAEGFRVLGRVLEVGDKIKMDFNHPFAGKTVRYEGEVELVRDATGDELKPTGCGCGSGGCGEGCGSDCGSNCEGCH